MKPRYQNTLPYSSTNGVKISITNKQIRSFFLHFGGKKMVKLTKGFWVLYIQERFFPTKVDHRRSGGGAPATPPPLLQACWTFNISFSFYSTSGSVSLTIILRPSGFSLSPLSPFLSFLSFSPSPPLLSLYPLSL